MTYTGKVPKCPRGGNRHQDSSKMGEEGLQCREGPLVCVCHISFWGCPPYLLALGSMDSVQLLTGAVLTWDRDRTRAPEGI